MNTSRLTLSLSRSEPPRYNVAFSLLKSFSSVFHYYSPPSASPMLVCRRSSSKKHWLTEDIHFAHVCENDCALETLCLRSLWIAANLDASVLDHHSLENAAYFKARKFISVSPQLLSWTKLVWTHTHALRIVLKKKREAINFVKSKN